MKTTKLPRLFLVLMGILLILVVFWALQQRQSGAPAIANPPLPTSTARTLLAAAPTAATRTTTIVVDDFNPQPYQGESVYFYNRLEGDRGAINNSLMDWGSGQVTTTVSPGNSWGGVWMSLNHPIREGLPINFSAVLPQQILPAYQSQITGITVLIGSGTPGRAFRVELKNGDDLLWKNEITLDGGKQTVNFDLPALGNINQLVWVLDRAAPGDFVVIDRLSFSAVTPITDTATAAFVWSYGMLLDNWNPATGLVRDKAKDASGEFDAIQATGCLAAATAEAAQLGVLDRAAASQIVEKIGSTLLSDLPRYHGLWPHWVKVSSDGKISILDNTEWSSVDTAIAAIGLLTAQSSLGMDTSGTEQMLKTIDWQNLVTPNGVSHGYTYTGDPIPYAWDVFGGESWMVELALAAATGQVAPLVYPTPPTANGSGFIDELAWLFVPPPAGQDYWGTNWTAYRTAAADKQVSDYSAYDPAGCMAQLGLFGLSAGEVPDPSKVPQNAIYQAFRLGGRFDSAYGGPGSSGGPVAVPHYAAMIASLHPQQAIKMWDWLINNHFFTPLNNVESLTFPAGGKCDAAALVWNQLKGSWNLSLQTLGWGRYLADRDGHYPALWQAAANNPFLHKGYLILASTGPSLTSAAPSDWEYDRECEDPDQSSVGQAIWRSNASGLKVHGQFGTTADSPWGAKSGNVVYQNIRIPQLDELGLKLRYSKNSLSYGPIMIYIDDELNPRATFYPNNQGDWNNFAWTDSILLGKIAEGVHSIRFFTPGELYGVADLDKFVLQAGKPVSTAKPEMPAAPTVPALNNDLLVWYDFEGDFPTSGIVTDRSGNGLDARVNGDVKVTVGLSGGQAASFSGNGVLQTSKNPAAGRTQVTFSLWFKTDTPQNNYKLASAAWWRGGPGSGWIMATHIPEFWSDDNNSLYIPDQANADNAFAAGKWIYEVVSYDGQRLREYTDGKLVNDWAATGAPIGEGQPMAIGGWPYIGGYYFEGAIDEFRIYSRCLTQEDILALYDQGR